MPFEFKQDKSYEKPTDDLYTAALKAAAGLGGQVVNQNQESGVIEIQFDKKILGNVLGDRTFMSVNISPNPSGGALVIVEAYPLDAIGRKLMFGARKGVPQTVVTWFYAHLEHHLA